MEKGEVRESAPETTAPGLSVRLLGRTAVCRDGIELPVPASRKCRALLGYLALATRPVSRLTLCDLLWDAPNDPRGELRWALSKLRVLLDEPGRIRLMSGAAGVEVDLSDSRVDALQVRDALQAGIGGMDRAQLRKLADCFTGEFLEDAEVDRQPGFSGWLIAHRRRFRASEIAVLEALVRTADQTAAEVFDDLDRWLLLAPLDIAAHAALFRVLARHGRIHEGEEHLEEAVKSFEAEGLDSVTLRRLWLAARETGAGAASNPAAVSAVAPMAAAALSRQPNGDIQTAVYEETAVFGKTTADATSGRASIAVMPFTDRSPGAASGGLAEGLAHDVITRLAKLRMMFVIAHGSVFALNARRVGPEEAGRMLNVDYVASGTLARRGDRMLVSSELVETRSARIIWNDTFEYHITDALIALDDIGNSLVASIAHEIEVAEINRAVLRAPDSVDAWEAYHRALWHMYRFTAKDNEEAQNLLRKATQSDPTFSRAYSALSFTHFQNAFLHRISSRATEIDLAYAAAGQSIIADEQDPSSHWAMGRALWLRGQHEDAIAALQRSVELCPNFAPGHYALGFVNCQSGDPAAAIHSADFSRALSPFDPLLFAMFSTRALGHLRLGEPEAAAAWALKGSARPNSHAHTQTIAAHCLAVAGRTAEARALMQHIRRLNPQYRLDDFLTSFHFAPDAAALLRQGAKILES